MQIQLSETSNSSNNTVKFGFLEKLIPNGSQTYSKCPERYVNGVYPKALSFGNGCYVYDDQGIRYTDYISSLGAILLGYKDENVDNAVIETIRQGKILLSLPHKKENDLAERLVSMIPCAQQVKYFKTGSEACSAAVRLARAYTGRELVLTCGYHGWHDWYQISAKQNSGIPGSLNETVRKCVYNDLESFETYLKNDDVACVILEPVVYEAPERDFLQKLVNLAHQHGALIVFDEMVTGFRFGFGGASEFFKVTPDLACIGKSMANGYPMAALVGKSEYMSTYERDDFFVSGTFGGDLIGITASIALIDGIFSNPLTIMDKGDQLKNGFNLIAKDLSLEEVCCKGFQPRTHFSFPTMEHKALFMQECVKRKILFGYANFVTQAHHYSVIEDTLDVCETSLKIVKDNWNDPKKVLEGDVPKGIVFLR